MVASFKDTIVVKNAEPEIIESFNPKLGFVLQPNSFGSFVCKDEKTGEYSGRVTIFKPLSMFYLLSMCYVLHALFCDELNWT